MLPNLKEPMLVTFTKEEVLKIVLDFAQAELDLQLNKAEVDGYSSFTSVTLSYVAEDTESTE